MNEKPDGLFSASVNGELCEQAASEFTKSLGIP